MTPHTTNISLAVRLALRELRGGLNGFRVFLACLALGVGAIAAVGSMTEAFRYGVMAESHAILGGDIEVTLTQRDVNADERAWLNRLGKVSRVTEIRAMARGIKSDIRNLVELKAADSAYPLYGTVVLKEGGSFHEALAERNGHWGVAVESNLLPRLGIQPGDLIKLGALEAEVRAVVEREPDRVGTGFILAPRIFLAHQALALTDLVQVGSQVEYKYRVLLQNGLTSEIVKQTAEQRFEETPWRIRDPAQATRNAEQFIDRVSLFLTLVALSALLIGGVGIGNAVKSYLDGKTSVIATFKCLGAPGRLIFQIYLVQILIIAVLGIVFGLIVGAMAPNLVAYAFGDMLPVPPEIAVYPQPLIFAAIYGILATLTFAIWPLARAREVSPAGLFRDIVAPTHRWPRKIYVFATALALAMLCVLAIGLTPYRMFAVIFIIGAAGLFFLLRLEAIGFMKLARAVGRPRDTRLRMALANLYRPGAPTASVVLSMGLGLTLLVAISLIDGNIVRQVTEELPERAPSFFMLDIRRDQAQAFDELIASFPDASEYRRFPMVRARITELNGEIIDPDSVNPEARWFYQRERNLTYRADIAEGTVIVDGEWWPADYDGPPAISIGADIARGLGIGIGDTLTFDIIGRSIEAKIVNLRAIEWGRGSAEFAVIFAPGALEQAPQQNMVTVRVDPEIEEQMYRAVADAFPNVSIIWIRDAIEVISELLADLALAVRAATSITLVAGVLVLAGAIASGHRHRVYDAVILKVLGATRGRVLATYVLEYAILGFGTAILSAVVGTLGAYLIVTQMMDAQWHWLPVTLAGTVLGAALVTILLGLLGTWRALGQKVAPVLRAQ
ncbi:MAG: FtsX-like permease family protein [Alphaproteobacteria bacterium]|nr:MAG: FtsX-like permease family protein [Alphaproteobacteria bacterium]